MMDKKPERQWFWVGESEVPGICDHLVVLRWDDPTVSEKPHWVDFEIHEATAGDAGYDGGGEAHLMFNLGDHVQDGLTYDCREAKPTMSGYVKWDGCTEVDGLGGHYCDARSIEAQFEALRRMRNAALEAMGKAAEQPDSDWLESTC